MTDEQRSGEEAGPGDSPRPVRDAMEAGGGRPTPVRLSMDTRRDEPEPAEPPATRLRRGEDEEWVVRVEGRAETGGGRDAGAPLLFLTFARAEEPGKRLREAVVVGRGLDRLTETDLLAALDHARPFRKEWERSDLFAGTRKNRGT